MANKTETKKANGVGHNSKKKTNRVTLEINDKDLDKLAKEKNEKLKDFLKRAHKLIADEATAKETYIRPIKRDMQQLAKDADKAGIDKKYFKRIVRLEQMKLRDIKERDEDMEYKSFQNYFGYQPMLPIVYPD